MKTLAENKRFAAGRASGILTPLPRHVPLIDMAQAGIEADLPGAPQGRERGTGLIGQPVRWIKLADMPGGIDTHLLSNKPGKLLELPVRIIVAGDDESGQFQPYPEPFVLDNRFQDFAQLGMD